MSWAPDTCQALSYEEPESKKKLDSYGESAGFTQGFTSLIGEIECSYQKSVESHFADFTRN